MITAFFVVVFGITGYVSICNGEWGPFWISVALVVLALLFHASSVESSRAYLNRIDYWSRSGPERARLRRNWEAEAREEETREMQAASIRNRLCSANGNMIFQRQQVRLSQQVQQYSKLQTLSRGNTSRLKSIDRVYFCQKCGAVALNPPMKVLWDGRIVKEFHCPNCKELRWIYI